MMQMTVFNHSMNKSLNKQRFLCALFPNVAALSVSLSVGRSGVELSRCPYKSNAGAE